MTLPTRKNYICTCVSFINILTELPKPSTTTLAYMEDYDEKTHIKGKMRSCKMITQAIFLMVLVFNRGDTVSQRSAIEGSRPIPYTTLFS